MESGRQPNAEPVFLKFMEPRNRFQEMNSAILCSLAGRYDNPIPTRFLVPIDCLKIPAPDNLPACLFLRKAYKCFGICIVNYSMGEGHSII
jgi:hypothetical protein